MTHSSHGSSDTSRINPLLAAGMLLAVIADMVDLSITTVALPAIRDTFDTGMGVLMWAQIAGVLPTAAIAIQAGAIGDRFGRQKTLIAAITTFVAGALLSAFATGPVNVASVMLIVGRVLTGAGGTVISVLSLALLTSSASSARIRQRVGLWTAITTAAGAVSMFIAGFLVDTLGWRIGYGLPAVAMIVAALSVLAKGPKYPSSSLSSTEWRSYFVFSAIFALLIAGILGLEDHQSVLDLGLLTFGIVGLFWFTLTQRRSATPLIPWSELRSGGALPGLIIRSAISLALAGAIFETTFLLLSAMDYTATQVGALSIAPATAATATSAFSSKIVERIGASRCIPLCCATLSAGIAGLSSMTIGSSTSVIIAAWALVGGSTGLLLPTLGSAVLGALPGESHGRGAGIILFTSAVANAIGVTSVGIIATRMIRGAWTTQTSGVCATDTEVLSDLGAGAFTDIAHTCGPELAAFARTIYVDTATPVIQAIAIAVGLLAASTLRGLRRPAQADL